MLVTGSESGISFLVLRKVRETMAIVIQPPKITEGTVPKSLAAVPDSKAPISFDEPINIEFTAETRPRIWSGVKSCIIVPRIITLMLSNAPSVNKKISDK